MTREQAFDAAAEIAYKIISLRKGREIAIAKAHTPLKRLETIKRYNLAIAQAKQEHARAWTIFERTV